MAANEGKDLFVAWLNDAHAMETAFVEAQESQIEPTKDHPALQAGIKHHLEETRQHGELVKQSLEELGESPSGVKSGLATVTGNLHGRSTRFAKDEAVKIGINNHVVEQIEIASYKALIQAAEHLGHQSIAERCRQILAEEEAMSAKIDDLLPALVDEALATGSN